MAASCRSLHGHLVIVQPRGGDVVEAMVVRLDHAALRDDLLGDLVLSLELLELLAQLLVGAVGELPGEAVPGEPGQAQWTADVQQRDPEVVAEAPDRL